MGFRFRLHRKDLPGKPDIVLPKYRTVIFVHGCFWHRHDRCKYAYEPKTRKTFWREKFEGNIRRDREHLRDLRELGWQTMVVWECQVKADPVGTVEEIASQLIGSKGSRKRTVYKLPTRTEVMKVAEGKLHARLEVKKQRKGSNSKSGR